METCFALVSEIYQKKQGGAFYAAHCRGWLRCTPRIWFTMGSGTCIIKHEDQVANYQQTSNPTISLSITRNLLLRIKRSHYSNKSRFPTWGIQSSSHQANGSEGLSAATLSGAAPRAGRDLVRIRLLMCFLLPLWYARSISSLFIDYERAPIC